MTATALRMALVPHVLFILTVPALASNTGFTKPAELAAPAENSALFWISLPYRYLPEDVGTPAVVDAEDLCHDLGDVGIEAILRWDEATATFSQHVCGDMNPYSLTIGTGYAVVVAPGYTILEGLTGGHDDAFAFSVAATGGSQLSWLSVPYHLRRQQGFEPPTAADVCNQIGPTDVLAVVRSTESGYESYGCGSEFDAPFPIVRGEAYGVINRGAETIDWQPLHH